MSVISRQIFIKSSKFLKYVSLTTVEVVLQSRKLSNPIDDKIK